MKIGLIGDIHANLPALEAVFAHGQANGVEQYWNIGDFVGYNAFPDEVVEFISGRGDVVSIIGNYDLKVLKIEKKRKKWAASKSPEKLFSFEWTYQMLSKESRDFMAALPKERRFTAEGWNILLTHGSPASNEEHLLPSTPEDRMEELAGLAQADLIICGHSHQAFTRKAGPSVFINTGSVGRPDDGDPRAAYAILTLEPGRFDAVHLRIPYEVERAVRAIRERGLPEDFARMVRSGRNLDDVKNQHPE